jgi:hypothetical protein
MPLTLKAKTRLAETGKLFDAVKAAEAKRNGVWDTVKAANRAIEAARLDVNSLLNTIGDARDDAAKAKKAKQAGEAQLAAVMKKASNARSQDALEALAKAEDAAEARLLDLSEAYDTALETVAKLQTGIPDLKAKLAVAEAARRALDADLKLVNQFLKDAQSSHALARREDTRYFKPVSVLVSRKDQRLYVRQGFDPVLEVPIAIANPDQPLGTHLYTAMGVLNGGAALEWSVVSLNLPSSADDAKRAKGAPRVSAAAKALDRIEFPPEALDAIRDVVKPGSSLIITDDSTSQYFGNGTDFTVAVN